MTPTFMYSSQMSYKIPQNGPFFSVHGHGQAKFEEQTLTNHISDKTTDNAESNETYF